MTSNNNAHTDAPALTGKRALITGGTTGIGRAIAVLLASEGVDVFICGLEQQYLEDALADIYSVGKGDGMVIDLACPSNVAALFERATSYLGGLDVAVVNAAIAAEGISEMDEALLLRAIATDFTAYLLSARTAIAHLGDRGDIILIGSMSAHGLGPGSTVYAGIKYGIQGFAEALRRELGPKGIKVSLDMQYPDISTHEQHDMIAGESMLRAEDIAVGVHYLLTQPRRAVVQQLTISPRMQSKE